MIVQCPNCHTKFNLPDNKIPAGGAKVRCSRCSHVFKVTPPAPMEDDDLDDLLEATPDVTKDPTPSKPRMSDELDYEDDDDDFESDFDLDISGSGKKKKGSKKASKGKGGAGKTIAIVFLVLLLLLGGTAAGLYFAGMLHVIPGMDMIVGEPEKQEPVDPAKTIKLIVLENVRQYYVNNEKAGPLFVIEGKAVNQFKKTKEFIKLEASIFDSSGNPLEVKEVLCGNVLSYFQLQVLSRTEIEAALNDEMGVLNNNTNLAQGMETQFMIVFFDPPKETAQYGVKVIESLEPPKD